MARKLLSEYQENWIKTHANNSCREDQYKEFCLNFGNIITFSQFSHWRRNNKIKGPKNIHSVSKHKAFTAEEEQFILENYKKYESPQIVILLKEKFGTTHTKQQIKSFRNRYKLNSGFTGGFNSNRPNPHKGDKSFIIPVIYNFSFALVSATYNILISSDKFSTKISYSKSCKIKESFT